MDTKAMVPKLMEPWTGFAYRLSCRYLDDGYYVQSLKTNGKSWTKNWFEHDDVMINGGTIEFEPGAEAKAWETGEVPPSPRHVQLNRDRWS